ncbi:MAG TPA: hypothetical protein VM925_23370 [Labilithrix sp.]|nr:hypothetical protein [Labilithrix sp.]
MPVGASNVVAPQSAPKSSAVPRSTYPILRIAPPLLLALFGAVVCFMVACEPGGDGGVDTTDDELRARCGYGYGGSYYGYGCYGYGGYDYNGY